MENANHVNLSWRSWIVVFFCCFAILAQVFVVVAAGSVLSFIIRDIGEPAIASWIIQGPLLMQSVLSPLVGRLSDVMDRKYMASLPPIIAMVGSIICAKATSMNMLIGGGILIGTTLATIAIVQSIPSEILPLKYRPLANGFAFLGGAFGSLSGGLSAGAVTAASPSGWRNIFWIQAGLHGATSLGLLAFYWPKKRVRVENKHGFKYYFWACDPIGSLLFIVSATLMLLALNWAGGRYKWSSSHVAAPLGVGIAFLIAFCLYEWKGRDDGIVAHVFSQNGPNFWLSTFAFAVEGWIYYSAVNSVTPQIILNLGFEDNSWDIAIRQLSYKIPSLVFSLPVTLYSTYFKDMRTPLVVTYAIFLAATIGYARIAPSWDHAQIALTVLTGIGTSGPLTLLVACIQFSTPHEYLSTATGLAFSARAIGGAFGSAVISAVVNSSLNSNYNREVGNAALAAGLPPSSLPSLLTTLRAARRTPVKGATPEVMQAAWQASYWSYARAYRLGWWSVVPFVVLATVAVACLRDMKKLFTEKIDATVEHVQDDEEKKVVT